MRPLILYLLSLLVVSLSACSQDPTTGTTTVSGQVVEYQTKKPVGKASVQVYHARTGGGYVPVGTPYASDGQGRFSFDFNAESQSGYKLLASAPPGYATDWALAPGLTAGRKNTDVTIPVYAPAWVKLQLVDELPKSRVSMYISGYNGPGDRLYYPRDTSLVRPHTANNSRNIIWVITNEKGVDTQYSKNVNPGALDTVAVRIPF